VVPSSVARIGIVWSGLLCCIGLFLVIAATAARAETPAYVGSAVCADCHSDVLADWEKSDHAKAWTLRDVCKRILVILNAL
jgi:Cytochrome c554 and c-prime